MKHAFQSLTNLLFTFSVFALIPVAPIAAVESAEEHTVVRIGVLAHRGKQRALKRWSPTAHYLSERVGRRFEIVPVNLDEINQAIREGDIHFTLTNPGNYVSLETRFGVSRIATLQRGDQGQIRVRYGAVIISRADNTAIEKLRDLKGRSFMAVSPVAFGGFQMAWRELMEDGVNPFRDFSELEFAGFPQDQIIFAVQQGDIDAATVRAETLMGMVESGKVRLEEFRILNPQHSPDSPLPLSTRLYPEWPFATLKSTPRELAAQVAQALLSMPPDHPAARASQTAGWTIPLDYSAVHRLMKVLQIGPYEALRQTSFLAIVKRYAWWLVAAGVLLVFLIVVNGYVSRNNRRLKEIQQNLRDEIGERKRSQAALARYRDTLEEQVAARTQDLETTNLALEKSRVALRELVVITGAPDLTHDERLARLLDTGREYFGSPVAVRASAEPGEQRLCRISGDGALVANLAGPLNELCVSRLLERNGEPLDIPDLERGAPSDCACRREGWKSYLGAAVLVEGRIHCTLEFASTDVRDGPLSQWDHELLKVMAQWIGDELERQMAYESQQRHQTDLARVSRMSTIGEMAASLAHELNQPLTGTINYSSGCLRLLREGEADTGKLTEGMERAVESARLAADIIRHTREFVQKGEPTRTSVDLNHAVGNVVALATPEAQRHDVNIQLDLARELPPVKGDMIQLEQVVLNFIRNGIDALDAVPTEGRNLTIKTLRKGEDTVCLSTADSGEGIAADVLPRIFDAFYTTKPDGMGIGLSISRSIIESHQGRIMARSLEAGGAEFSFELPVEQVS
jgi:C4-dicarboxylate-specific signal transduction histidine kinase